MGFDQIHAAMRAEGLSAAQKAVLLNYCIRADEHGYSYPSRQRIADDTGLALRTVNYAKKSLIEMGLVASKVRYDSNGRQINDLVRVNLAKIKSMARPERDYRDNLIEEITFSSEEKSQAARGAGDAPSPDGGVQEMHPRGATDAGGGCTPCTPEGAPGAPKQPAGKLSPRSALRVRPAGR